MLNKYYRLRAKYYRLIRLTFPSAAEVRFIEILGGRVFQVSWLKPWKNRSSFTVVLSLGKTLRREHFRREVRYGKYYVDFANDLNRIIEIDGAAYHMDVIADMDRYIYINHLCFNMSPKYTKEARILRVKAYRVYNNTRKVQDEIIEFIQNGRVSRPSQKS